jgi:hypothetical protein
MTLQRLLRQQPSLREITENIFHHTWARGMRRRGDYGRFKDEYYQNGFQSGIINVVIPDRFENPLFAGVQDIHVHIFPTKFDGAGIRIGFGNGWRLDYESGEGRDGEIFIRSPDGHQHPQHGLSDRLSFPQLARGIRNTLNGLDIHNQVPNDLLNITDDKLRDFIEYILFHLMTQIQQHRIRGGKKKTYRKYKDKKIKTRRKNLKKTRRKNLKKTRRKNLKKTKRKNRKNNRNKKHTRTKKANGK